MQTSDTWDRITFHIHRPGTRWLGATRTRTSAQPAITRVVIVKNQLTLDGTDTLKPLPNGTFSLGDSIVRFDSYAGSEPQRLSIDDTQLYRVELP